MIVLNACKWTVSRKKWLKMVDFLLCSFIIIYFALSLRQRIASFYAEFNDIFLHFLRPLLKICIQIMWIVLNKKKTRKHTKIPRRFAFCTVRLYKHSQKLLNIFISFAQFNYGINSYFLLSLNIHNRTTKTAILFTDMYRRFL